MGIMAKFKKLFCAKKNPACGYMSVLHALDERHNGELLQQKMILDGKAQAEIRNAYWRGYGEAQADIFAALKKEPEQYHAFIENHRV